jgi:uncharacterized protein (DUF1800 family)
MQVHRLMSARRWLVLGLCAGVLGASCVAHAGRDTTDFQVQGNYTGDASSLTLSTTIVPATVDRGTAGSFWVAAGYANSILFMTPGGWLQWISGPYPAYSTGSLNPLTVPIVASSNVSALECLEVLVGYGRDATDMLANQTYGLIYQVPASRTRTSSLPCSTSQDADISRFLEQAGFGPTDQAIAEVKQLGLNGWLNRQFSTAATGYGSWPYVSGTAPTTCDSLCLRDNYSVFQLQRAYFQNALSAPDQLRQRVAFALSQIMVISAADINLAYANAEYHNLLSRLAFGGFETLLTEVTLNPAMGRYLDMVNNGKPTSATEQANENYARELLQLFSIGLYQLNQDGTVQTDANGRPIPSYDEDDIKEFARAFTGWTYPPLAGVASRRYNPPNYIGRMVADSTNHDTGAKTLLNGTVLPAGQSPDMDLADAIRNIFMHSNVGPFIGKQLIQKLVTSNPSPSYVSRVSAAFADNGQGVRGDMKAVLRAVLLDPEARGGMKQTASYGHLREPALFIAHLLRALGGTSDGVSPRTQSAAMGQNVMMPPSVFNFYPPDYTLQSGLLGPEFAIQNASTGFARANFVYQLVYGNGAAADATVTGSTGTHLDITPYVSLASDPARLVDRLDLLLTHGTLSPNARTTVINAIASVSDLTGRARLAIYLIAASSQFLVEQ